MRLSVLDALAWRRWSPMPRDGFQFMLKGFCWLIILGSLVDAAGERPGVMESRSFQQLPFQIRKHRNSPQPAPTSFSHPMGGQDDLKPAAQTLYDLRGYHIPLGGPEETQQYIRQQNQQQPQQLHNPHQQNPLVYPSFYQPQNSQYFIQGHQGHHEVSDFGHGRQQAPAANPRQLVLGPTAVAATQNFKPSQPDLGQGTTEDAFKPFNPPGLVVAPAENKREQVTSHQEQEQRPYIYVYDDPDYDVEVDRSPLQQLPQPQQEAENTNKKGQGRENEAVNPTPGSQSVRSQAGRPAQYEFFEEDPDPSSNQGQPNNNIPFSGFVDDHGQSGSFIPGRHFTSGPNVQIIPSSERKPPPDVRNTVPATLVSKPKAKQKQSFEEVTVKQDLGSRYGEEITHSTLRPEFEEYPTNPSISPAFQPAQEQELYNQPFVFQPVPETTTERERGNILTPVKKQRRPKVHRPIHTTVEPEQERAQGQQQYDPILVQKLNPYLHPDPFHPPQKLQPVTTIIPQDFVENYPDPEIVDNGNILQEEEEIPTTTTRVTPTTSQPSRSTSRLRDRFPFPPFAGRSATTTTTTTTTTQAPRVRTMRPRPRPRTTAPTTTTTTTTTTTPPPPPTTTLEADYYEIIDSGQVDNNQYPNSIEEEQKVNQEVNPVRNGERVRNEVQNQHHSRGQSHQTVFQQQQPLTFREQRPQQVLRRPTPSPTPVPEEESNEVTPTIRVRTRGRVNPTPTQGSVRPQSQRQPIRADPIFVESPVPPTRQVFVEAPAPPTRQIFVEPQHPPTRHRGQSHQERYVPDFTPFPEVRQQPEAFLQHIPRGRKQPPQSTQGHRLIQLHHHSRPVGKPLYVSGKMLEKEGGLYAGYHVNPQHHMYGYGLPLPFIPIPPPAPPKVFHESIRQSKRPQQQLEGRQRDRERTQLQVRQPEQSQRHQEVQRPPTPPIRHRQEIVISNEVPSSPEPELESPILKIKGRIRQMNSARKRKQKAEGSSEQHIRQPPEEVRELQVSPEVEEQTTRHSRVLGGDDVKLGYEPKPLVLLQGFTPTPNPYVHANRETSAPSIQIELPATPKPNPLKRRPLKRIRVPGPLTTTATTTTTTTEESRSPATPTTRKTRPRPPFMRPPKPKEIEPIVTSSVTQSIKASREPTQAPRKYSSKYNEEEVVYAAPPEPSPTVFYEEPEPVSLPPLPTFINGKTRPMIKVKKKPKSPSVPDAPVTPPRIGARTTQRPKLVVREVITAAPAALPTSILLSSKDVLQNRKPARRIPPGSASDRLKSLTERRRKLFTTRVKPSVPEPSAETDYEDGGSEEPDASNSEQSKREIRVQGNVSKKIQNRKETSAERDAILGIPKPDSSTPKTQTEFHLFWEAVETTSAPPTPLSSQWKDEDQLERNKTTGVVGISVPIIEFPSTVADHENPLKNSYKSPFNIYRLMKNESEPTLPNFQPFSIVSSSSTSTSTSRTPKALKTSLNLSRNLKL